MNNRLVLCAVLFFIWLLPSCPVWAEKNGKPRFFLLKKEFLDITRQKWQANDPLIKKNMLKLLETADKILRKKPSSIMDCQYIPPSKDRHDFMATGVYYWPDPANPDGKHWIYKDGFINPDSQHSWKLFKTMTLDVEALSLAYYFTGNEKYARQASLFLRTWFINKETAMNPNLNYGKFTPGVSKGGYAVAGMGLMCRRLYDAAGILENSESWSISDKSAMQKWTRHFISWVESSPYGKTEQNRNNNHGSHYDMILTIQSLYCGDTEKAKTHVLNYIKKRLPLQFLPNGTQPLEMKRANNYLYHCHNLMIAFDIARLAEHLNIDVWHSKIDKDAGLYTATLFLAPYLSGSEKWPYFKKHEFKINRSLGWELLRRAACAFADPLFEQHASHIPGTEIHYLAALLFPIGPDIHPDPAINK